MLVHKATMGVLDLYWTGRYRTGPGGVREPEMREYTLEDLRGAAGGACEDEWWSVPRGSALGRKLRRAYPFCTAVTAADGSLVDVVVRQGETRPARQRKRPGQRRRRAGLLEHILEEGTDL